MAPDDDLPTGYDPELSRLYGLAEDLTDALTAPQPDRHELAAKGRELAEAIEAWYRRQSA